ncbi:MAG: hypothetical protein ACFCUQ_18530 [Kiloniellales bacterium]
MTRSLKIALAAGTAALLAGCAQSASIPHNYVADTYDFTYLGYAAGRGGMLTEVVGNPFDAPKPAVDTAVTETLEASHFGPRLPFFTEPPADYRPSYRTVVLFNPAPGADAARLCGQPNQPQAPRDGRVGVLAAFCSGSDRINSAGGSVAGAQGPDDPAFRGLLRQVSLALFPVPAADQIRGSGDHFRVR